MALAAKLQLRQSQSLVMTPQLMQSIRLLQLTHVELEQFIEEEIERNPLIERAERPRTRGAISRRSGGDSDGDGTGFPRTMLFPAPRQSPTGSTARWRTSSPTIRVAAADRPDLTEKWKSAGPGRAPARSGEGFDLEDIASRRSRCAIMSANRSVCLRRPVDRLIAADLTDGLDEAGYFAANCARSPSGWASPQRGGDVLLVCQTFEPTGIFARTWRSAWRCSLPRDRLDPAMRALLANLELLARRDFAALAQHLRRR